MSLTSTVLDLPAGIFAVSATNQGLISLGDSMPSRRFRLHVPTAGSYEFSHPEHAKILIRAIRTQETPDPVPHEALLTEPKPLTLQEEIARFLGDWTRQQNPETETFEEADDFDLDDDDLPYSPYEVPYGQPENVPPEHLGQLPDPQPEADPEPEAPVSPPDGRSPPPADTPPAST